MTQDQSASRNSGSHPWGPEGERDLNKMADSLEQLFRICWPHLAQTGGDNLEQVVLDAAKLLRGIALSERPRRSFNDGLRYAIVLCEGERVNAEETGSESDIAYNTAIKHCVERINIDLAQPQQDERNER